MNPNKNTSKSRLLNSRGWESCVDARFLRATDRWTEAKEFNSHGHVLRRLFEDVKVDAVLFQDGRPTVCVKDGRLLSNTQIEEMRKKLWNLGATTLLMIERPSDVLLFSTLAKPSDDDLQGTNVKLASETIENLEAAESQRQDC